eukprot:m.222793 g.222793  ORF g.222793 m.222793 type:complete len:51 (-) comp16102_c0_seq1:15-167(-)
MPMMTSRDHMSPALDLLCACFVCLSSAYCSSPPFLSPFFSPLHHNKILVY